MRSQCLEVNEEGQSNVVSMPSSARDISGDVRRVRRAHGRSRSLSDHRSAPNPGKNCTGSITDEIVVATSSVAARPGTPPRQSLSGARSTQRLVSAPSGCMVQHTMYGVGNAADRVGSASLHNDIQAHPAHLATPRVVIAAGRAPSPHTTVGQRHAGCTTRHSIGGLPSAASMPFLAHASVTTNIRSYRRDPSPPQSAKVQISRGDPRYPSPPPGQASWVPTSAIATPPTAMAAPGATLVPTQAVVSTGPAKPHGNAAAWPSVSVRRSSSGSSLHRGGLYPTGLSGGMR